MSASVSTLSAGHQVAMSTGSASDGDDTPARQAAEIVFLRERLAACAPRVSVVVICWNNRRFLKRCFDSLTKTNYPNLEVLLADNASSDGSAEFVATNYPTVRIVANGGNLGFAEGNNRAIRRATGDYVCTLNPDTEVHPDWLLHLVHAAQRDRRIGMCSPKMYIMDAGRRLNSAGGDMLLRSGDNLSRAFYIEDDGRFDRVEETFGPSAGAALYRREMLDDIGLFDRGLFTYYEDVDLNLRAQLRGWRCAYVPDSVVQHYQSGTLDDRNPFKLYLLHRNKWYVVLKDFPPRLMWRCRRELLGSWRGGMGHIRHIGHPEIPRKIVWGLIRRLPRILWLRAGIMLRRTADATRRIGAWMDRHEDTYRELGQAAAVQRYYDDLRSRGDADSAG